MRPAFFATPPMRAKVEPEKFWQYLAKTEFPGILGLTANRPLLPGSPPRAAATFLCSSKV